MTPACGKRVISYHRHCIPVPVNRLDCETEPMKVLVTGVAGFIGNHVALALLERGVAVVGVDNMNDYYDVTLKEARLARFAGLSGFTFSQTDIADRPGMEALAANHPDISHIIHLAAQAGVRYSLENPYAYVEANVMGQLVILELCRKLENLQHLVYASSSSVYGGNTKVPFAVEDRTDTPVSLYAATKRADELMGYCYSHLYGLPATGLRFFTVYGPWGRPDMAAYLFTKAIFEDRPIKVFNRGDMKRDFTFIDDIVSGVLACLEHPPEADTKGVRHAVYNIGNNQSEPLMGFIETLEAAIGRKAEKELLPMQPGDVKETYADITAMQEKFGFEPKTPISVGLPKFVAWFRDFHGI
jgi:UDP-glucuronate 4-epimerase